MLHLRLSGLRRERRFADRSGDPIEAITGRPARVALLLGNEPRGVEDAARASAARTVAIPIADTVESLNVAVAAGILLHAIRALPVAAGTSRVSWTSGAPATGAAGA